MLVQKGDIMAVDNNDPSCLDIVSIYTYPGTGGRPLADILNDIRTQITDANFALATLILHNEHLDRLQKLAVVLGINEYTLELREKFLADSQYGLSRFGSGFCKSRYEAHRQVIHWVDSFITTGQVDYSPTRKRASPLRSAKTSFIAAFDTYVASIGHLAQSTKEGYCRIVGYFLDYLDENKGYVSLDELQKGDVGQFIIFVVETHYRNSLSAVLPGLKAFLEMEEFSLEPSFRLELPSKLKKHQSILKPLSTTEVNKVYDLLDEDSAEISMRNRAITEIAIGTGNRSVDILGLTFSGLDLENDRLRFVQHKTGKTLDYPLTASMGNAIVDYILYERPKSESQFIFLSSLAPHTPLLSHSACRLIIKHVLKLSEIDMSGRQIGTRLTRHSRATYLLNNSVPLPIIAQSIGHKGMGTVQVYLTADEEHMAECILPVPMRKAVNHG